MAAVYEYRVPFNKPKSCRNPNNAYLMVVRHDVIPKDEILLTA